MTGNTIDKSKFDNSWYKPGPLWKRTLWYYFNIIIMKNSFMPFYSIKNLTLKLFGAKIGRNCKIKPCVNIKYPWFLHIGKDVTIGENVWIDNLAKVSIGDSVTISQGALLLTGNHNYNSIKFDLMVEEISIEAGAWICAKSIVGPGVTIGRNAVLGVGSIATNDLEPNYIYSSIQLEKVKQRKIS